MASSAHNDLWTSIAHQSDKVSSIAHDHAAQHLEQLREETTELQVLLTEAARIKRKLMRTQGRPK